MIIYYKHI